MRKVCVCAVVAMAAIGGVVGCNHFDGAEEFRECPECFEDAGAADGATTEGASDTSSEPSSEATNDAPPIVVADADLPECPPDAPDIDEDKHVAGNVGIACGDDCDDGEARAHPGQTDWFDFPAELAGFDWNCDRKLEAHFTELAVCANPSTAGGACVFSEGWLGPSLPGCGVTSHWVTTCAELSGPGTCGVPAGGLETRVQECH